MTIDEFMAWAYRLGLTGLTEADLHELHRGWLGIQPQLERVRTGFSQEDRPPLPPLGLPGR